MKGAKVLRILPSILSLPSSKKWRTEVRKAIDQLLTEGLIKQAWVENEHIFIIRK